MTSQPNRSIVPAIVPAREEGYMLLAVIFLTVLVLIALAVAAPRMAASIERDREVELMHRGNQYVRAIRLYYRKFGAFPPTMDALVQSNNIRFLRKRYVDPMTGKDEWHIIHFGEAKTATPGFFGQPIGGASSGGSLVAGIGPSGGNTLQNGQSPQGPLFGGSQIGSSASGSSDSSTTSSASGSSTDSSSSGSTTGSVSSPGGSSTTGPGSATPGGPGSATPGAPGGQTFGGGGIIGVESNSTKTAILMYRKKKHFNEWEFVYDPLTEQATGAGAPGGGANPLNPNGMPGVGMPGAGLPGAGLPGSIGPGVGSPMQPTPPQQ